MDTLTYRNHSLYRYDSHTIISNKFDEKYIVRRNGPMEVSVTSMNPQSNNNFQYSFDCAGVCLCYDEGDDDIIRKSVGNLVYSYRYASLIVVSVYGYAISKFVNEKISDCYESAKMGIGGDQRITCSMEKLECKEKEVSETSSSSSSNDKREEIRRFECNGHCITKKFRTPSGKWDSCFFTDTLHQIAIEEAELLYCEGKYAGKEIIDVYGSKVHVHDVSGIRGTKNKREYDWQVRGYYVKAVQIYRTKFLTSFCKSFRIEYYYERADRKTGNRLEGIGCISSRKGDVSHIQCKWLMD